MHNLHQLYKNQKYQVLVILQEGHYNPDLQNKDGDTLLHLVASDWDFHIAQLLFKMGANPTIRNKNKKTPIDIFFLTSPTIEFKTLEFFNFIQENYPDARAIIPFLNAMPFSHVMYNYHQDRDEQGYLTNSHDLLDLIQIKKLPADTLKDILNWTGTLLNHLGTKNTNVYNENKFLSNRIKKFAEKLKDEIKYLNDFPELPSILNSFFNANAETKNVLLRTMLLDAHPYHLGKLLAALCEDENILSQLSQFQYQQLKGFLCEYETKRVLLENLDCVPNPLTAKEIAIVQPICKALEKTLCNADIIKLGASFREKIIERERMIPERKQMIERYREYQKEDKIVRRKLFIELLNKTREIQELDPNYSNENNSNNFTIRNG